MKRNLIIDANVPTANYYIAVRLAKAYICQIEFGTAFNPLIRDGYSLSYGDKNVYVKRLKSKECE